MSATACALLRHDVRPRWIGDLLAAYCHTCGCIYIPEREHARQGRRDGTEPLLRLPVSAPLPAVLAAAGSTTG